MTGKGDPYALTAGTSLYLMHVYLLFDIDIGPITVFAAEAALALLAPRESLPAVARAGGVLTPMSALGTNLIRRLSASGRCEFESNVRE